MTPSHIDTETATRYANPGHPLLLDDPTFQKPIDKRNCKLLFNAITRAQLAALLGTRGIVSIHFFGLLCVYKSNHEHVQQINELKKWRTTNYYLTFPLGWNGKISDFWFCQ